MLDFVECDLQEQESCFYKGTLNIVSVIFDIDIILPSDSDRCEGCTGLATDSYWEAPQVPSSYWVSLCGLHAFMTF